MFIGDKYGNFVTITETCSFFVYIERWYMEFYVHAEETFAIEFRETPCKDRLATVKESTNTYRYRFSRRWRII